MFRYAPLVLCALAAVLTGRADAQVTVYPDCNFQGPAIQLGLGPHGLANLKAKGAQDDALSAIQVAPGYAATLYEKDQLQGRSLEVAGSEHCLVARNFDNLTSSIMVSRSASSAAKPAVAVPVTAIAQQSSGPSIQRGLGGGAQQSYPVGGQPFPGNTQQSYPPTAQPYPGNPQPPYPGNAQQSYQGNYQQPYPGNYQQPYVRITNRWKPSQSLNIQYGNVQSAISQAHWHSADWTFERVDGQHYRIKNRWKNTYLHNQYLSLQTGPVEAGWWSAMWVIEPAAPGFFRIRNRWKNTYLHNQYGTVALGAIQPNWWSAMWAVPGFR